MKKKYLLDTNICIFFMRGKYDFDKKLRSVGGRNCYISSIVTENVKHLGLIPKVNIENWINRS